MLDGEIHAPLSQVALAAGALQRCLGSQRADPAKVPVGERSDGADGEKCTVGNWRWYGVPVAIAKAAAARGDPEAAAAVAAAFAQDAKPRTSRA